MRPLEEEELKQVFEKLHKYVGKSVETLVNRKDQPHVFRLHKKRVFYVREDVMKRAISVARENLIAFGASIGKFTHSGKFILTIGALDLIAQHAKYKVWIKGSSEMSFLYGNHVLKSGLGRITENTPQYAGVVCFSMNDVPLGFGTAAKSTLDCRKLDPSGIVCLHQADTGEYLRNEADMVGGKAD